jgi:hypothetical protein
LTQPPLSYLRMPPSATQVTQPRLSPNNAPNSTPLATYSPVLVLQHIANADPFTDFLSLVLGDSVQSQTEARLASKNREIFLLKPPMPRFPFLPHLYCNTSTNPNLQLLAFDTTSSCLLWIPPTPLASRQVPPLPFPNSASHLKSTSPCTASQRRLTCRSGTLPTPLISAEPKSSCPPSTDLPSHAGGVAFPPSLETPHS